MTLSESTDAFSLLLIEARHELEAARLCEDQKRAALHIAAAEARVNAAQAIADVEVFHG